MRTDVPKYTVEMLRQVTDISQTEWDSFARAACDSPFLQHEWLRCLEQSGCASSDTGWTPRHIVLRDQSSQEVVAIAPAYLKEHSLGEFIFDQEWAEAAYGAGILYYPKLLIAVPFTPASGRRILTKGDGDERRRILKIFARALIQICDTTQVSSVHVNFCRQDEVEALSEVGFLQRKSVQYHFTNYMKGQKAVNDLEERIKHGQGDLPVTAFAGIDAENRKPYTDFDEYLSEFKSKKRINIRRERKYVREQHGLSIEVVRGHDITKDLMEKMFYIYKTTIDKLYFGRQYLSLEFFQMLADCEDFRKQICLILAKSEDDGSIVGGTFNVVGETDGVFYGRYWGCTSEYRYLHFEVCYYAAIEFCINNGLLRMEPGAGGGDFKYMRGFEPSITMSMHYLRDKRLSEAVERFLMMESMHIEGAVEQLTQKSAIRSKSEDPPSTSNRQD